MTAKKKLTEKHKLFVKYYPLCKFNAGEAYAKAYNKKTVTNGCYVNGHKLLKNANIQEALAKSVNRQLAKLDKTQEDVIHELNKIGFSDIKDFMKINKNGIKLKDLENVDTSAIESASMTTTKDGETIRLKLHSKNQALKMLGDHFDLFNDRNKLEIDLSNLKIIFANVDFDPKEEPKPVEAKAEEVDNS